MTAELLPDSEEREEITTQNNVVEQKTETDEDRNWKAFLATRKEEQKAFEAEKEKNRKLAEDNSRRQKELEDLKVAFQVMVEKKDTSVYDDDDTARRRSIQEEFDRMYEQKESARRQKEDSEKSYRESMAIKQEMPDLLDVCSQENLAYLEYYNPEIAIPLGKLPDGLEKTKLAYQAIKKHVKMAKKEQEKVEKNLNKPKSIHSAYSNETTSAEKESSSGVFSEKRRNETWQKMQRLISGEDEE